LVDALQSAAFDCLITDDDGDTLTPVWWQDERAWADVGAASSDELRWRQGAAAAPTSASCFVPP